MLSRLSLWLRLALGLLAVGGQHGSLAQAQAAHSSGVFSVRIQLAAQVTPGVSPATQGAPLASLASQRAGSPASLSQGLCVSASLEAPTRAAVRVVCNGGEFVTIEPEPGEPFPSTSGEVYRYVFGPGMEARPSWLGAIRPGLTAGTVTAYQFLEPRDLDDPLQLLVRF